MSAFRIFNRFAELLDINVTRAAAAWLRLNADGTVTERTAAETILDINAIPSEEGTANNLTVTGTLSASTVQGTGELRLKTNGNIRLFSTTGASFIVRNATDTANLFEVNNVGNGFFSGGMTWVPAASATPANNAQMVFERTSNTSVTLKLKGTDGTVRSVMLTLA